LTKAEKALRNKYATQSDIAAFKAKVYFQSKAWPKDVMYDISQKMYFLMEIFAVNDIEYIEDKLISYDAETDFYKTITRENISKCYFYLGIRTPEHISRTPLNPAAVICNRLKEAQAMQELYAICIDILNQPKPEKKHIFELLFFASRCADKFEESIKTQTEFFPVGEENVREVYRRLIEDGIDPFAKTLDPDDELFSRMPYRGVPKFPLVSLFRDFTEQCGEYLQKKYGCLYERREFTTKKEANKETDEKAVRKYERYPVTVEYWYNKSSISEAKSLLWNFATKGEYEQRNYIKKDDVFGLAELYMSILDEYLSVRIEDSHPVIDSVNKISYWVTDRLDTAAFLWVYADITSNVRYGVCSICGSVFIKGNHPNELYCNNHTKQQKDNFRRKVTALERASALLEAGKQN